MKYKQKNTSHPYYLFEIMKSFFILIFSCLLLLSCDSNSSIVEFNKGFSDGYKDGLKSNGCKDLKKNKIKAGGRSFKNGYIKGFDNGVLDCIKIMQSN
ncbi:MAG: hypothetical protein CBD16_02800 [Betaproteobacteria bacterium TMED156]|nr:MAG: hypothetical protein CBD16_02800 [Betaproteobacteria bacterium TMED156]|tara:strand:- start:106 stop:399 length:294 start_codon:yes stop_codon:yes gene_type:complete